MAARARKKEAKAKLKAEQEIPPLGEPTVHATLDQKPWGVTFEVNSHKRLFVAALVSDGAGAGAGLREGLVLATVNGKAVPDSTSALKMLQRKPPLECGLCEGAAKPKPKPSLGAADDERSALQLTEMVRRLDVEEGVPRPPAPARPRDTRAGGWTVHVKTMTGAQWPLEVRPDESMEEMRATLWAVSGTMTDQQKLVWATESGDVIIARDDRSARDYGIHDGATLTLVAQEASVGQQERTAAERERERLAEEERRASEHTGLRAAHTSAKRTRAMTWIGAIAMWQAGLWTQEPAIVLSTAGTAVVLLLYGLRAVGWTVAELDIGRHSAGRERGRQVGYFVWGDEECGGGAHSDIYSECGLRFTRAFFLAALVVSHMIATGRSVLYCSGIEDYESPDLDDLTTSEVLLAGYKIDNFTGTSNNRCGNVAMLSLAQPIGVILAIFVVVIVPCMLFIGALEASLEND